MSLVNGWPNPPFNSSQSAWPSLPYGQQTTDVLKSVDFPALIERLVGRTIPSANPKQTNKAWVAANVTAANFDSCELARRLYNGSTGSAFRLQEFLAGAIAQSEALGTIDLRKPTEDRLLFDPRHGWQIYQRGLRHNGFLPRVWREKVHKSCIASELFLARCPAETVRLFTCTCRSVDQADLRDRFRRIKDHWLACIRAVAREEGYSLLLWRIDWGVLKVISGKVRVNLHLHIALQGPADPSLRRAWRLRKAIKKALQGEASCILSTRGRHDARRLPAYLLKSQSLRSYRHLSDTQLVEFFCTIRDERKFSLCGPLYLDEEVDEAKAIRRLPDDRGRYRFAVEASKPESESSSEEVVGEGLKPFVLLDYFVRPFVAAIASERYSLLFEIKRRPGSPPGRIDPLRILGHPYIAWLIHLADEAWGKRGAK